MVEPCLAPAQAVMTERGIRDSQEPDLADSRSSVKLNLARGAFCWHHKNGRQTGAKMVNTERVWQDWRTLRVIWARMTREEKIYKSCCKSSIISHAEPQVRGRQSGCAKWGDNPTLKLHLQILIRIASGCTRCLSRRFNIPKLFSVLDY